MGWKMSVIFPCQRRIRSSHYGFQFSEYSCWQPRSPARYARFRYSPFPCTLWYQPATGTSSRKVLTRLTSLRILRSRPAVEISFGNTAIDVGLVWVGRYNSKALTNWTAGFGHQKCFRDELRPRLREELPFVSVRSPPYDVLFRKLFLTLLPYMSLPLAFLSERRRVREAFSGTFQWPSNIRAKLSLFYFILFFKNVREEFQHRTFLSSRHQCWPVDTGAH